MTITKIDSKTFNINVPSLPEKKETYELKVVATLEDGSTLESTKEVTALAIPVDKIIVTGDTLIKDHEYHNYQLEFTREDGQTPNIGVMNINVTSDDETLVINIVDSTNFKIQTTEETKENVNITITAILVNGTRITNNYSVNVFNIPSNAVDLGLPSGRLWCTHNVGADTPYTYAFTAFQWGETVGNPISDSQNNTNGRTYDSDHYAFSGINANIAPDSGYDAARAKMGGLWRMPTKKEFQELYDNCTNVWTTLNGIAGILFTSKINAKTVFFPACGYCGGSSRYYRGSYGNYWSSSCSSSSDAYYLHFDSTYVDPQSSRARYRGRTVRPVI